MRKVFIEFCILAIENAPEGAFFYCFLFSQTHYSWPLVMSTLNKSEVFTQLIATTAKVIHPPNTVAVIVPKYFAASPD